VAATLFGLQAPAQAADNGVWSVYNAHPSIWIGVYDEWLYSDYEPLAPQHWSDLQLGFNVEAVYIGSGWCARRYTGPGRNGPWTRAGSDIQGPFKMRLAGDYVVKIDPYKAASSSSCV
jgi:hypothetical protein